MNLKIRAQQVGKLRKKVTMTGVPSGLLQFSQKTDYGLFLLSELAKAQDNGLSSLRLLAEKNSLSFSFLQKVAFDLRRAGILKAARGKHGGYILAHKTSEITLLSILEALEGPLTVMNCLVHDICSRANGCHVRPGLQMIYSIIAHSFSSITLADLLSPSWKTHLQNIR